MIDLISNYASFETFHFVWYSKYSFENYGRIVILEWKSSIVKCRFIGVKSERKIYGTFSISKVLLAFLCEKLRGFDILNCISKASAGYVEVAKRSSMATGMFWNMQNFDFLKASVTSLFRVISLLPFQKIWH